jgi:hypothetical protein
MRSLGLGLICLGISGCSGCKKSEAAPDAAPSASVAQRAPLVRDETGHLKPKSGRPPDNPADLPPQPGGEPDWDLDAADPAKDYVERYIRATQRYGASTRCAEAKTGGQSGGKTSVDVGGCVPKETFQVDVTADRLEGTNLKKWPDGSDPGGPRNPTLELDTMGPLRAALLAAQLTPIRFQGYARGAYVVVTLAGWRPPVTPATSPEVLRDFATKVCAANQNLPLGLLAGIDRATIVRVRCGALPSARWDRL